MVYAFRRIGVEKLDLSWQIWLFNFFIAAVRAGQRNLTFGLELWRSRA